MAERRAQPREDRISRLLEAEIDGERLDEHDLMGFFKLLSLARLEAQTMLRVLFERSPDLALAEDAPVVFFEGIQANGAVRLPLRFAPSGAPS